jgi:hypothetical protein
LFVIVYRILGYPSNRLLLFDAAAVFFRELVPLVCIWYLMLFKTRNGNRVAGGGVSRSAGSAGHAYTKILGSSSSTPELD